MTLQLLVGKFGRVTARPNHLRSTPNWKNTLLLDSLTCRTALTKSLLKAVTNWRLLISSPFSATGYRWRFQRINRSPFGETIMVPGPNCAEMYPVSVFWLVNWAAIRGGVCLLPLRCRVHQHVNPGKCVRQVEKNLIRLPFPTTLHSLKPHNGYIPLRLNILYFSPALLVVTQLQAMPRDRSEECLPCSSNHVSGGLAHHRKKCV